MLLILVIFTSALTISPSRVYWLSIMVESRYHSNFAGGLPALPSQVNFCSVPEVMRAFPGVIAGLPGGSEKKLKFFYNNLG